MGPKEESLTNLENQIEKIINISTQTNGKFENFKKNIVDTNKTLLLAEENQQKLVLIEENNETLKKNTNKILEVSDSITRDFKEQPGEMYKHNEQGKTSHNILSHCFQVD